MKFDLLTFKLLKFEVLMQVKLILHIVLFSLNLVPTTFFSYIVFRALRLGYLTQDQIDYCDPVVMIAVPRLAIVWWVLLFDFLFLLD